MVFLHPALGVFHRQEGFFLGAVLLGNVVLGQGVGGVGVAQVLLLIDFGLIAMEINGLVLFILFLFVCLWPLRLHKVYRQQQQVSSAAAATGGPPVPFQSCCSPMPPQEALGGSPLLSPRLSGS